MDDCPLRVFCEFYLPKGACIPHEHKPFGITCIDEETCCKLSGASLAIFKDNEEMDAAYADQSGLALFSPLCPGRYLLETVQAPAGYNFNKRGYKLFVAPNGDVMVDGIPIAYAKICFAKPRRPNEQV